MNGTTHFLRLLGFAATATLGLFSTAQAQEHPKNLSLSDAIAAVLANNKNIQLARLDANIATANYKQTDAIFLPQADLSYSAMSTNNPLNAFGFKLQQGTITQNNFDPALLNHPSATPDYAAKLEVKQPLLNIDMLYMRKGAEKQTEVYQYKTQRTREYMTFEITKGYLQLQLAYEALKVLTEAASTAKSVFKFTDDHLTGFGASAYLVGVQLSWNVFNGNKTKHLIAAQKLERDKLTVQLAQQKDQSQLELNKAYRDLSDARFEMGQDQAAIDQAIEALRILQNRYQQGLVNTTDVLTADTQLSQLKFSLAQAQFTANVTGAYIQLLTSTTTK